MLRNSTIDFLKKLKKNNSREWFEGHRQMYEEAREDFVELVAQILKSLSRRDARYAEIQPKHCIFRINRDVRFSHDKSPYKTNFGAAFSPQGKKSPGGGFYLHIEPSASFAGGGIWMPEAEQLRKIRQEIDYRAKDFKNIVEKKSFLDLFGGLDREAALKNPPKGYDSENPMIEYLKLKNFVTGHPIPDRELCSADLLKGLEKCFREMEPLMEFLQTAITE